VYRSKPMAMRFEAGVNDGLHPERESTRPASCRTTRAIVNFVASRRAFGDRLAGGEVTGRRGSRRSGARRRIEMRCTTESGYRPRGDAGEIAWSPSGTA